ncbi:MAG: NAD(P)/FAD-dependent oxidoreductase [Betaproteobacteria bacterium]
MNSIDVAVIGAGPAGLASATRCREFGLDVMLFDEQPTPGGQIYRGITRSPLADPALLGDDYWQGGPLVEAFAMSGAIHVPAATVWSLTANADGFALGVAAGPSGARTARIVQSRAVIVATGAIERPFPISGWTLPGVMTAGGAQILLKASGVVPQGRTVLAGCGPLLWLLAWQYLRAGVVVDALLDTTPRGRMVHALRHAVDFARSPYFAKGRAMVREVRRHVRVIEHVNALAIEGDTAARAVRYAVGGRSSTVVVDQVLLHQGVVPDVNLAQAAGCTLAWNSLQASFAPMVDAWGGSDVAGLYVAGDGAGIAGALAAPPRGRLAALSVANALGRISHVLRDTMARHDRAELAVSMRGRTFLDTLFRPADAFRLPTGPTLVCRCEEIDAQTIVELARQGCAGPNQMKAFTRCGMGPCQGRFCGLTVTELIAREQHREPGDVGHYRLRFPVKPITLAELAAMPTNPEAVQAVERP